MNKKNDYDYWVSMFVEECKKQDKVISMNKLTKNNLKDYRWYIKYCPDKSVKSWAEFINWCGFITYNSEPSKELVIKTILKLREKLDRPLYYNDFRGRSLYHVGIETIRKYWGTVNNMKKELGLEIIQEDMTGKQLSKEMFDKVINDIVEYVNNSNKDFITTTEIDNLDFTPNTNSLNKYAKKYYGLNSFSNILAQYGIREGQQGQGIRFTFDDGEITTSQFEYLFSNTLRNMGLVYNKDYFRNIKYNTFIPNLDKNIDCDYMIIINNVPIYIEIAGIIHAYKSYYYKNKIINVSKSKENYRKKLLYKENLLKENNLKYFILFPCDLSIDNIRQILKNPSIELKHNIEKFIKNNIDWNLIVELGGFNYSDEIKYGRNIIKYGLED